MLQLIDSHCHLNYYASAQELDTVIKRAQTNGIKHIINICTKLDEADKVTDIADQYNDIFASVGIHPNEAKTASAEQTPEQLYEWLIQWCKHQKVIAIGETGLDYHYQYSARTTQLESFKIHIQAAKTTGLPLVIHTRSAAEDTINTLKQEQGNITGVIHCFSETKWLADNAMDLGFYISIPGIITFKKSDDLRKIVATIPLERLLLETDAPFLAPVPYRGKQNEPAYMIKTAELLAELKNVSLTDIAKVTTANCQKLFQKGKFYE